MTPRDSMLATAVAVTWGLAFIVSKVGLRELSPAALCAARFAIAALPCLLVRRPQISWLLLISISATLFVGQFVSQFYGIAHGVPAGLTAVIVQGQALFTVVFAAIVFGEIPSRIQLLGLVVAVAGLAMVCATVGHEFSVQAFAITMISPVSFAVGNLLLRRAQGVQMFDLMAWLSLVVPLPLFAVALLTDGVEVTLQSFAGLSWSGIAAALMLGILSTTLAYWAWGYLLRRYSAAEVVPFALLVPVVASVASMLIFGEQFAGLRLAGMVTLVLGVAITLVLGRPRPVPAVA